MPTKNFLVGQLKAIRPRILRALADHSNLHYEICNSINKLRNAIIELSDADTAYSIREFTNPIESSRGNPPYPGNSNNALFLCDQLIDIINPAQDTQDSPISRITPESKSVFIVHGHDTTNLLRLQKILKERLGLNPVVLMDEPSSGKTIIEKFEQFAGSCSYCFALMTPDDQVTSLRGEISVPSQRDIRAWMVLW